MKQLCWLLLLMTRRRRAERHHHPKTCLLFFNQWMQVSKRLCLCPIHIRCCCVIFFVLLCDFLTPAADEGRRREDEHYSEGVLCGSSKVPGLQRWTSACVCSPVQPGISVGRECSTRSVPPVIFGWDDSKSRRKWCLHGSCKVTIHWHEVWLFVDANAAEPHPYMRTYSIYQCV